MVVVVIVVVIADKVSNASVFVHVEPSLRPCDDARQVSPGSLIDAINSADRS